MKNISNEEIRNRIFELADEKYKKFHSSLCPNTNNIVGVRIPILRNFAKELVKEIDWKKYLKNASNQYYEEIMLQGMIIGLATTKENIEDIILFIDEFVPKIDNWAICDSFCAGLKITNKYPEYMWRYIQKYLKSDREFELRFAIVMILDYFIKKEYIDDVIKILNTIKSEDYYVKMAVAWTISVAFVKFEDKTMNLLKNNTLDNFTYNKSIQKIIESYRVNEKTKEKLKKMKRIRN